MSLFDLFLDVLMEKMKYLEHKIDDIITGKFQINTIRFIKALHFLIEDPQIHGKCP